MFDSNVIPVKDVLIRSEIAEIKFACDLNKCKGACCTLESEFGAPLLKEEVDQIKSVLEVVKDYLPAKHKEEIDEFGFYELKHGELMTASVNNKACVFVYYENGIAKCGIERAFLDGKIKLRKPISCHLFPIRVSKFGGDILRFEKFSECSFALENGAKNNIKLVDFCKDALERLYGKKWYLTLKEIIGKLYVIS
ncbi:MAG: DUF3109 family protein [Bacteroidetes bacterium]|nr:DUF3109 family protein [Bacteroidota bacterium]